MALLVLGDRAGGMFEALILAMVLWTDPGILLDLVFPPVPRMQVEPFSQRDHYRFRVQLTPQIAPEGCSTDRSCVAGESIFVATRDVDPVPEGAPELNGLPASLRAWALDPRAREELGCSLERFEEMARLVRQMPDAEDELATLRLPQHLAACFQHTDGPDDVIILLKQGEQIVSQVDCPSAETFFARDCRMTFVTFNELYWGAIGGVPFEDLRRLIEDGPGRFNDFMATLPADAPPDLIWQPLPERMGLSEEVEALLMQIEGAGR